MALLSQKSRHVEIPNSPAVGNVRTVKCILRTLFGFALYFQLHLDLRVREQKRKRRFKERVLIPIILLVLVPTFKKNAFQFICL